MKITISDAMAQYLDSVHLSRSRHTARSYGNALAAFKEVLQVRNLSPDETGIHELPEEAVSWFAYHLKVYASATEQLYLTALAGFYQFLVADNLSDVNLPRVRLLIKQRGRRPGVRLPQFPKEDIETVLEYAINIAETPTEDERERLRDLRDRAFLFTLADTGLRVHEACNLRRGDVDMHEGKAVIIGKGDRQAVIRFSTRSLQAIKAYLTARAQLDGGSGKPLTSLPLFARHDKRAGDHVKPISTRTGRNIVTDRVRQALGERAVGTITPHSFRHYFVTTVLQASGNLKLAQELARHRNIQITQRYAHLSDDELDRGYHEIFNQ
jgi:integrase/recombinase XerC